MKRIHNICPVCGNEDQNRMAKRADGWLHCSNCGQTTYSFSSMKMIPVYEMKDLYKVFGHSSQ